MGSSSSRQPSAISHQLLLITDGFDGETVGRVRVALRELPGAAVQLRAKRLDGAALYAAARALREVAPILLVNDRADVALAAGCDGVHLPARGLDVAAARGLVGATRLVGVSTHSREEAIAAARAGADYVVFGPVWPTGTRPGDAAKGAAVGVEALAEVVRACAPMPVFALGGVDAARAPAVLAVGARIACIGAVLARLDVAPSARALAAAIG
jgi:thiamine-phosphate pyrophosphorylase